MIVGAFATTLLIVRFLLQKRRVGQREIWRRNRRMVIQLASISIMYNIVWIPSVVCFVVPLIIPSPISSEVTTDILNYSQYLSFLLCPFMCLIGLPEIRHSLKQTFIGLNIIQPLIQNPTVLATAFPTRQQKQNQGITTF